MSLKMLDLVLLLGFLLSGTQAAQPNVWLSEQGTTDCSDATYDPDKYVCYDTISGFTICPIVEGVPWFTCSKDCYNNLQYECNDGVLSQRDVFQGTFTLLTVAPLQDYDEAPIQANGGILRIGGDPGVYCPSVVDEEDCPYTYDTAYSASQNLAVMVPGGQKFYTRTDGHIAFTQPHSQDEPDKLYEGAGVAHAFAGYFAPNNTSWLACKDPEDEGVAAPRHLLVDVEGRMEYDDCDVIFLQVVPQADDDLSAWEYL